MTILQYICTEGQPVITTQEVGQLVSIKSNITSSSSSAVLTLICGFANFVSNNKNEWGLFVKYSNCGDGCFRWARRSCRGSGDQCISSRWQMLGISSVGSLILRGSGQEIQILCNCRTGSGFVCSIRCEALFLLYPHTYLHLFAIIFAMGIFYR